MEKEVFDVTGIVTGIDKELGQLTFVTSPKLEKNEYYKFKINVMTQNQYEHCGDYIP